MADALTAEVAVSIAETQSASPPVTPEPVKPEVGVSETIAHGPLDSTPQDQANVSNEPNLLGSNQDKPNETLQNQNEISGVGVAQGGDERPPQENIQNNPDTGEREQPNPETYRAVQGLVGEVQEIIKQVYDLEDTTDAAGRVWDGKDAELEALVGRNMRPGAATYTITHEGEDLGAIIHFPDAMMDRLAHSSAESRLKGNDLQDMLALVEETSHYLYIENYKNRFLGQKPHNAAVEMVGVIDKYNILQALFLKNFGRNMNSVEQAQSVYYNAIASEEANWTGDRPAEYIVGHDLGLQYVYYLNGLYNQGVDVSQELLTFYGASNKHQVEHLLYDLGLTIEARTSAENVAVGEILNQMDVRASNA